MRDITDDQNIFINMQHQFQTISQFNKHLFNDTINNQKVLIYMANSLLNCQSGYRDTTVKPDKSLFIRYIFVVLKQTAGLGRVINVFFVSVFSNYMPFNEGDGVYSISVTVSPESTKNLP